VEFITHRGGRSAGAIRVSFGLASNFGDVHRFLEFAVSLRDQTRLATTTVGSAWEISPLKRNFSRAGRSCGF
jgi:hypothetical protein